MHGLDHYLELALVFVRFCIVGVPIGLLGRAELLGVRIAMFC